MQTHSSYFPPNVLCFFHLKALPLHAFIYCSTNCRSECARIWQATRENTRDENNLHSLHNFLPFFTLTWFSVSDMVALLFAQFEFSNTQRKCFSLLRSFFLLSHEFSRNGLNSLKSHCLQNWKAPFWIKGVI